MNYTLQQIIAALSAQTITINTADAELTRQAYLNQYQNYINTAQYVPILTYNLNSTGININNTDEATITSNDLFTANDWVCINSIS